MHLDQVLAALYRCPGDEASWHRLAGSLASFLSVPNVHLVVFGPDNTLALEAADNVEAGHEWARNYAHRDPAIGIPMLTPSRRATWSAHLFKPELLARCPVQNDLLPRFGIGSRSWVHSQTPGGFLVVSTAMHGRTQAAFEGRVLRNFERLHIHLEQAMHLHLALQAARGARTAFEAGLDALPFGMILLDRAKRPLFANRRAEAMFRAGRLVLADRRIAMPGTADDAVLRRLLFKATERCGTPLGGAADLAGLGIRVIPVTDGGERLDGRVAAVMVVHEETPPTLDPVRLQALGLTEAEAALAAALVGGESLSGYAARRGRAISTVRAQLRTVFAKTGTHRQAELVLHLLQVAGG